MANYRAYIGETAVDFEVRMPGQCVLIDGEPSPIDSAGREVWRRAVAYALREDSSYRDVSGEDVPEGVLTWNDVTIEKFEEWPE